MRIIRVGKFGMFSIIFLVSNVLEMYFNQFIITDVMNGVVSIKDNGVAKDLYQGAILFNFLYPAMK